MKSIKPGRGPSGMGAFMGVVAAVFGVFWLIIAVSMGAYIMIPFGLIFIIICVANAVYNYKNATSRNRYSSFDIVDEHEEEDPLNARFGKKHEDSPAASRKFCPYCGEKAGKDHKFCSNCGSKLE